MYFAKARKQMDEQDMREVQEKLEKYQRSDSARVQLQQLKISRAAEDGSSGSRRSSRGDFRPDELPDGAFVSPKHTPSQVSPAKLEPITVSRSAEYIGSFSVTGADEEARTRQVETQLESLRSVTKSKKVVLVISLEGIKVCSEDLQNVYMFHELKRISYATCDPDHWQFSFLARERQMNVLYCHTFLTQSPEQAEELNLIIGNAFKMAYAQQRDKQPTFHELIEAQVAEQQAKFREVEKQAQVELQRKLADIARPTPFSQHAIQRMEQRRQASEDFMVDADLAVGRSKVWAKHSADHAQHRISLHEAYFSELPGAGTGTSTGPRLSDPNPVMPAALRRRDESEPPTVGSGNTRGGRSTAHKNITKHNSAPLFPAQVTSPSDDPPSQGEQVSCVIPHHPLSAQAIRVSMETKKDAKFKGSPVTALKNEIDKRFLSNGSETAPLEAASVGVGSNTAGGGVLQGLSERETDQKAVRQELVRQQIHMASRPLPSVPPGTSPTSNRNSSSSNSSNANANNTRVSPSPRPRQRPSSTYQFRSYDDHHYLPSSSSSPSPLSAANKNSSSSSSPSSSSCSPSANGVAIRNSPRRKQARPLSEIATGSGGMIVGGAGSKGYDNWHPMTLYEMGPAASSSSASASVAASSSSSGLGPSPNQSPRHSSKASAATTTTTPPTTVPSSFSSSSSSCSQSVAAAKMDGGVYIYGPTPGGVMAELRAGGKGPRFESSPQQEGGGSSVGSGCPSGNTEPVLRYQNDSPFHVEDQEAAVKMRQGLESLMCLDRSHIEDPALRQASWYQAGIPREIALEILQQEEVGSFIVRDSTTHPGCFALSVRVPKFENSAGISHYLILKTQRGVKLKGLDKEWPTLTALVTHHTVMPEMLPCTLRLPRNNKNLTFRQADRDDAQDPQTASPYHRLSDVTAMASQLQL